MASTLPNKNAHENRQTELKNLKVVVLAGGVGGAKMADGFAQLMPPENLVVIVNTGDDFVHCGLNISPDLDTVIYTLAGLDNPETGWGRAGETWRIMEEVGRLGGPEWFSLGDLDLALHLTRSQHLSRGKTLTLATQEIGSHLGVKSQVLPMSDGPAATIMDTEEGLLPFQSWFVEQHWQPAVRGVVLPPDVQATAQVAAALEGADIVVFAPSNPFVSIDPILNVYPIRAMISDLPKLVVAISPIIAGQAVKGPAAKMMAEMDLEVTSAGVAGYYGDLIDLFVYDRRDHDAVNFPELLTYQTDTLMTDRTDRGRLALEIMNHSMELIKQ